MTIAFLYLNGYSQTQLVGQRTTDKQKCFKSKQVKQWTIMVFMNGDNDLEGDAIGDINEMESTIDTSLYNVIVEIDRIGGGPWNSANWIDDVSNGNWTGTRDYYILPDSDPTIINSYCTWNPGEKNMGDPQTLIDFANNYIDNLPAYNYCLILWDHGSGWNKKNTSNDFVKWIGYDFTNNDSLDVANGEYYSALYNISSHLGRKIDLLCHDACLMAMQEVAYEAKYFASILIFSEHTEPGDGYPYNDILNTLNSYPSSSPADLASIIVNSYTQSYNPGGSQSAFGNSVTQSAIYTDSYYDILCASINTFAQELINAGGIWNTHIGDARYNVQQFKDPTHIDLFDFADLIGISSTLPTSLKNSALTLKNDILNVLLAESHYTQSGGFDLTYAHGLAIYYPSYGTTLDNSYSTLYYTNYYPNWWTFLQGNYPVVGIHENTLLDNIEIYPNPANDIVNIDLSKLNQEVNKIQVYDNIGKEIISLDCKNKTSNIIEVNTSKLSNGLYFVNIVCDNGTIVKKLSIQK